MNNDYVIITDSTTDLPQATISDLGLEIIPYIFILDGKEYHDYPDRRELAIEDFYQALREGKAGSTSLVTQQRYMDVFSPILKQGKDIIYICLSSGMSASYAQSVAAAEELKKEFPERTIITIDSLSACMGQGLLAYYASKAKASGKTLAECGQYIKERIPKVCHWVSPSDLHHLKRGGRVTPTAAFLGTLLNVRPIIHVDDEGKLIPVAKVRGSANVHSYFGDRFEETVLPPKDQIIFISHSDAADAARKLADYLIERFGKREIIFNHIGPVIGAHTGPGTVTVFFLGSKR